MSIQTDLSPSNSAFVPVTLSLVERFNQRTSCRFRITNVTGLVVSGLWVYGVYSNAAPALKDVILASAELQPYESVAIDGGPFNFPDQGSVHAVCGTASAVTIHISKVTF